MLKCGQTCVSFRYVPTQNVQVNHAAPAASVAGGLSVTKIECLIDMTTQVLTEDQIERLSRASLEILERVGVVVPHEDALRRFADAGADGFASMEAAVTKAGAAEEAQGLSCHMPEFPENSAPPFFQKSSKVLPGR